MQEHKLSSYILKRYSLQDLSVFSALCSYDCFRSRLSSERELSALLGMNFISFEKYLREVKKVEIRALRDGRRQLIAGGRSIRVYEDDIFSSVTGALVYQLRTLYPEANGFVSSPLVQTLGGLDVVGLCASIDLETVNRFLEGCPGAAGEQLVEQYRAALDREASVRPYFLAEAFHRLLTGERTGEVAFGGSRVYDFHPDTYDDYQAAINGEGYVSIRFPSSKIKGRIPDRTIEEVMTFYEDNPNVTYAVSDDKRQIVISEGCAGLVMSLGLVETPGWIAALTTDELDSQGEASEDAVGVLVNEEVIPPAPFEETVTPPPVLPVTTQCSAEWLDAAVEHVRKWHPIDANRMTTEEREIACYGFPGARAMDIRIGKAAAGRAFNAVPGGNFQLEHALRRIHDIYRDFLFELPQVQVGLFAAGFIVRRKANFVNLGNGLWTKKGGSPF